MALFRCLFLIGLLFADLADDFCALVLPTPVDWSITVTEPSSLLSLHYRQQCVEQIKKTVHYRVPLTVPDCHPSPTVAQALAGQSCGALALADPLYALMSLQC